MERDKKMKGKTLVKRDKKRKAKKKKTDFTRCKDV